MKAIKYFIEGIYEMLTFKSTTCFDRWFEIYLGITSWAAILIMIWLIIFQPNK